jgi:tetratricopeptide (TPR) repeat protein
MLLAAFAAFASPALADLWYEHYAAAEKALANEAWPEAIEQLNSALEKKGDSGARARTYGMKFTAYFPYLKLGIAYYELNQLDAALQAFETEERLGAIAQSETDRSDLDRYRNLALEAQRSAVDEEEARIGEVVRESLIAADRLEGENDIDGAIAALGPALAVSPDEPRALDTLLRLRSELAEQQAQEDLLERVSRLVERGRTLLNQGLLAEASSALRQALDLREDVEARELLDQAQRRLRDQLQASQRSRSLTEGLAEVAELARAGRLEEALERLQPILTLDSENSEARALERTLLNQQAQADQDRLRSETLAAFLSDAQTALDQGRFEQALTAANRVLAVDAGNMTALDQLARAYRAINGRLLGTSPRQNFPPAIRFADQRQELENGALAQIVQHSRFRLTGVVIDDSAVSVDVFASGEQPLEASVSTQALGDLYITEFQLSHDLEPGVSTLRLVATDAGSLTSSAEYAVVYSRPFFRSVWFYAAIAIALAAGTGTLTALRARRRRRLRQRRFNPYMAGAPVLDDKLFFGREQLLERILQTLHNNSLLLHGERRIGKTSLQHQLKKRLEAMEDPAYEFFPVYIDLQGTREEHFFATLGEEIFEGLAPVLDGLEPSTAFSDSYTYRELVADLRAIIKVLRQRSDKSVRLVLLIDEVDELNAYDPKVNQKLRGLFMKSFAEDLVAVVSGVAIKREWDREGSPWYNFFEEIDVGPFQPEHARELVEKPIRGIFRLQDGVVERIVELTGGRPYRIQRLCMKLVGRAHELKRSDITVDDVEAIGDPDSRGSA